MCTGVVGVTYECGRGLGFELQTGVFRLKVAAGCERGGGLPVKLHVCHTGLHPR
jgi:hypothetical protein